MAENQRTTPVVSGVYFLFKDGDLEYVGQSRDCYGRIETHRRNGRKFDLATVMPLAAEFISQVERALIRGYDPKQNIAFREERAKRLLEEATKQLREAEARADALTKEPAGPLTLPISEYEARAYAGPTGLGTVSVGKAKNLATAFGIPNAEIDAAKASGALRFVNSGRCAAGGKPIMVALHSDVEAFCKRRRNERLAEMGLRAPSLPTTTEGA